MSEAQFEQAVVDLAHQFGWRVAGFRPARTEKGWRTAVKHDGYGYPDLTMVHRSGVVIFAELKVGSNTRTNEQAAWAVAIQTAGDAVLAGSAEPIRYRLWHPGDADQIATELSFGRIPRWNL